MSDNDRFLTIHFNDGTSMNVSFPAQIKNSMAALMEATKRLLEADKLVIHTEQRVIVIPWSSVKYVEASSVAGAALPLSAIKGAQAVMAEGSASA